MNTINTILRLRLGKRPPDSWLTFWGCALGGLAISVLSVVALSQHATNRAEFVLGAAVAAVACLLLILLGLLAGRVHRALEEGRVSWRSRRWELLSHVLGLAAIAFGGWVLADASHGIAEMVTVALLTLDAYVGVLCLGCRSTLARSVAKL